MKKLFSKKSALMMLVCCMMMSIIVAPIIPVDGNDISPYNDAPMAPITKC